MSLGTSPADENKEPTTKWYHRLVSSMESQNNRIDRIDEHVRRLESAIEAEAKRLSEQASQQEERSKKKGDDIVVLIKEQERVVNETHLEFNKFRSTSHIIFGFLSVVGTFSLGLIVTVFTGVLSLHRELGEMRSDIKNQASSLEMLRSQITTNQTTAKDDLSRLERFLGSLEEKLGSVRTDLAKMAGTQAVREVELKGIQEASQSIDRQISTLRAAVETFQITELRDKNSSESTMNKIYSRIGELSTELSEMAVGLKSIQRFLESKSTSTSEDLIQHASDVRERLEELQSKIRTMKDSLPVAPGAKAASPPAAGSEVEKKPETKAKP